MFVIIGASVSVREGVSKTGVSVSLGLKVKLKIVVGSSCALHTSNHQRALRGLHCGVRVRICTTSLERAPSVSARNATPEKGGGLRVRVKGFVCNFAFTSHEFSNELLVKSVHHDLHRRRAASHAAGGQGAAPAQSRGT